MPEEPTLIEETPAPEAAEQKPPEEVVPREQYVNLQRQLSRRDREEVAPVSRRERLRQLRETKPAAPTPQESPEIQYFNRRLKEEGYELSDSVVREVVSNLTEDDTPDVAIKRIKSEKEKRAKSDDDRIQQAIEAGVMAKLKELGVLKGDGQPSASATDRAELKRLYIENPNNPRAAEWEAIRNQR
jgi:hypothetical protein